MNVMDMLSFYVLSRHLADWVHYSFQRCDVLFRIISKDCKRPSTNYLGSSNFILLSTFRVNVKQKKSRRQRPAKWLRKQKRQKGTEKCDIWWVLMASSSILFNFIYICHSTQLGHSMDAGKAGEKLFYDRIYQSFSPFDARAAIKTPKKEISGT